MSGILLLAWRYVAYNKVKTAILTLCLTLTGVLPLTVHMLISHYGEALTERARATPLVVGAKGNRFDLVLKALYFNRAEVDLVKQSELSALRESGLAEAIPLNLEYTARKRPIVGTTLEYFEYRGLEIARGHGLRGLGQAVLGARAAEETGLGPGDSVFSDQQNLYDITKTYPLKLHVVGVLEATGTADDEAVFVDVKSTWIIGGQMHGHQNVAREGDQAIVLRRDEENVTTTDAIVEYNEVTAENLGSFHTHGRPEDLPLTAIIVRPTDRKSATLLKARYSLSTTHSMLSPEETVGELLGLVFKVKRFFDANFALVSASTGLFIVLIVLLSQRLRRREKETLFKIGCSRQTVFWLQAGELGIVAVMSMALIGASAWGAVWAAPYVVRWL